MTEPVKRGQPTKYRDEFCETAERILGEGYSEAVLAGECGVCLDTVTNWKQDHPEFFASVKRGRAIGARVWEDRLANTAKTGSGNATAIIFGLKNRQPDQWRDKTEQELSGVVKVDTVERLIVDPANPNR